MPSLRRPGFLTLAIHWSGKWAQATELLVTHRRARISQEWRSNGPSPEISGSAQQKQRVRPCRRQCSHPLEWGIMVRKAQERGWEIASFVIIPKKDRVRDKDKLTGDTQRDKGRQKSDVQSFKH